MNIQIQSIHFSPSEALNKQIARKIEKYFGKYTFIKSSKIFLKLQENDPELKQVMEVRLRVPHGELFAKTKDSNFYNALDKNIAKLRKQLEKYKHKAYAKS